MTLTIELNPTEEVRLVAAARQEGIPIAEFARKLVTEHLPPSPADAEADPTLALFALWEKEDAGKTLEEVAAEDQLWKEFEQGINATRQAQGMRLL